MHCRSHLTQPFDSVSQSAECQKAHWRVHRFGCSPLPADLSPAQIECSRALCEEEGRVMAALTESNNSWLVSISLAFHSVKRNEQR